MKKTAAREAIPFLLIVGAITLVTAFLSLVWAIFPLIVFAYILYFFRDPERPISTDPRSVICPADGKVISVEEVNEPFFTQTPMLRVAIFLSVFDVHVNRSPCQARIVAKAHKKGEFLDARNPQVDIRNEALSWHLDTPHGHVIVRQIAGLIARRIVGWAKEEEKLEPGQRFGMIRFGSRTDLYLPLGTTIDVKAGQRVYGGQTVLGRFASNPHSS